MLFREAQLRRRKHANSKYAANLSRITMMRHGIDEFLDISDFVNRKIPKTFTQKVFRVTGNCFQARKKL